MQPAGSRRGRRATACLVTLVVVAAGAVPASAAPPGPAGATGPAGVTGPGGEPGPGSGTGPGGKIERLLSARLDARGSADFWVRFADRADLTRASRIEDWAARGSRVAAVLRETAAASQAGVRARLDAAGTAYQAFWATNAIHVQDGSPALAAELAARPEVGSLRPTTSYQVPEPAAGAQVGVRDAAVEWGIANINAEDVWEDYGVRGAGVTVANIDTGVQYDHPALVDQYRGNQGDGTFDHNYHWFDAAGQCPDAPCDRNGHGTHTMGTMAGDDGGDNRIGVAPEVTWIAANGCCPTDAALVASGQWMLEPTDLAGRHPDASRRPHIINNSWGSELPTNDPFMEDISLTWEASGIFGMWSNGNSGPACRTSGSPGSRTINYSSGAHDVDNQIARFSSRGAGQDGGIKPDISAPGVDVRSAAPGDRYFTNSGTSMAAPHVAGAVALLWSAAPGLVGDVAGTRSRLDGTAVDTPDPQCGGTPERNNVFGQGRLDALALLDTAEVPDTGRLAVTVTDAGTGDPVAGAALTIAGEVDRERVTGADGGYALALPAGRYAVTVSAFGYPERTAPVTVTTGQTTTRELALAARPTVTVRGRVTDASGHGWPLYAAVTVDGMPDGTVYTRPSDGRYRVTLPAHDTYTLTVTPRYEGYRTVTEEIEVGRDPVHHLAVPVDAERCAAAGYEFVYDGLLEDFDAAQLPDGWTVVDHLGTGNVWRFDDPFDRGNRTGGEAGFAIAQSPGGAGGEVDSSLLTPLVDLTGHEAPILRFRQHYRRLLDVATVELTTDGGASWQTLREQTDNVPGPVEEIIPIPQAAGEPAVQVRFRLRDGAFNSRFWEVDDVFVGTRTCEPVPGGLVLGHVRDRNTGAPVNGATVTRDGDPPQATRSAATPDDPSLEDGFYRMFAPGLGAHRFTATADHYHPHSLRRGVGRSRVREQDFRLPAGRLAVEPGDLTGRVGAGDTTTVRFTVTNTGSAPARLELRERDGAYPIPRAEDPSGAVPSGAVPGAAPGAQPGTVPGAAPVRIPGDFSPLASGGPSAPGGAPPAPEPAVGEPAAGARLPGRARAGPWLDLPRYPMHVMDNAVGELDGRIYSAGGRDAGRVLTDAFVYDPAEESWSRIADLPEPLQAAAGAVIDGKFYVAGGWPPLSQGSRATYVYDPETDTWRSAADAPFIFAAAGRAVLDGQLYTVGGCTNRCGLSGRVHRYDPGADTWETLARYPESTSHLACAGIAGQVYCAGGTRAGGVVWDRTYAYDPATDSWTRKADLPIQLWGMSYTASSDRLLVSGGVTGGATDLGQPFQPTELTNEGFVYDPPTDSWSLLPAANLPTYRAGSTCGLAKVGGTMVVGFVPVDSVELLPTYGDCVPADVPWLSLDPGTVTVAPGQRVTVTATVDATGVAPGAYPAGVWIKEDTPYLTYPVDVTMVVPPASGR